MARLAAPAPGLHVQLDPLVGDLEHPARSVEEQAPEVGQQAEGIDIGVEFVGNAAELVDLVDGVELHLVAHHVVEASVVGDEVVASVSRSSSGVTSTACMDTPSRLDTRAPSRSNSDRSMPLP